MFKCLILSGRWVSAKWCAAKSGVRCNSEVGVWSESSMVWPVAAAESGHSRPIAAPTIRPSAPADEPRSTSHRLSAGPRPLPPFTWSKTARCERRGPRQSNESYLSATPDRATATSTTRRLASAVAIRLTPLRRDHLCPTPLTAVQQRRCKKTSHDRRQNNKNRGRIDQKSETHEDKEAA